MRKDFSNLVDVLRHWAELKPDANAYRFLVDGELQEDVASFAALDRRARAIAALLIERGARGERAVLLYPPSLEYVCAFVGCLYAGVVAVPAYPPDPSRLNRTLPRLQSIVSDAEAKFVLTTSEIFMMAEFLFTQAEDLRDKTWLPTDTVDLAQADDWKHPNVTADTVAFLQYTSGSTGTPRGVVLTHGNLVHNEKLICEAMEFWRDDRVMVSWLPPYHDMGLIGGILAPLYNGFSGVLLAPMAFLQKPVRWLNAISRYRGTVGGAPNFGYDLCVRKVSDEERDQLDLSNVNVLFSGAEPIREETLHAFAEKFAPSGFRRTAFYPCYGLAEATLIVSGGKPAEDVVIANFDTIALEQGAAVAVAGVGLSRAAAQPLVGCGKTILDQIVVIVDPVSLEQLPPARVGEIWVSGGSVASGYFRRVEQTKATFGATVAGYGERTFLRTGDLGFLQDGELFITGRAKDLIIVRGRNIYPSDIETTVERSYPALRPGCSAAFSVEIDGEERVVIVSEYDRRHRPDRRLSPEDKPHPNRRNTGDRRDDNPDVQAFATDLATPEKQAVLRASGFPPPQIAPEDAIVKARQIVAAEHDLVLHTIVLIKAGTVPKTSSGKIQRHACKAAFLAGTLEVVASDALKQTAGNAAPMKREWDEENVTLRMQVTPTAERSALVLAHLTVYVSHAVKVDEASLDTSAPLAALGLDSLFATQFVSMARAVYGVDIPVRVLFEDVTTVATLAQRITRTLRQGLADRTPPLVALPRDRPFPLSFGQERLWFLHELDSEDVSYNIVAAYRLDGALDVEAFRHALRALVARHDAFRTRFEPFEGQPAVSIAREASLPLHLVDLETEDAAAHEEALEREMRSLATSPFQLANAPLAVTKLLRLGRERHVFLFAIHHIVADGWSGRIIVKDLAALYGAFRNKGGKSPLPALTTQYVDYAQWQRSWLSEAVLASELGYWRRQLLGAPEALDLPTDRARPPVQSIAGAEHTFALSKETTAQVRELARTERVTPFMLLFAGFATLLARYTGQDDVLVGTPVSNRTHAETDNVVGFFVNTLVLRAQLSRNMSFRTLLEQARDTLLGAYEHQLLPFEKLVEALSPTRDLSRPPLVQVMFNLLDAGMTDLELEGLAVERVEVASVTSKFDLSVQIVEREGRYVVTWEYSRALFDAETVQRMARHYGRLLESVVAGPATSAYALDLLDPRERAQLLSGFNATSDAFAGWGTTVLDAIAVQSARRPDAVALTFEGRQFTYRGLAARSDALARVLIARGLRAEEPVGVCMERSQEMLASMLAVLKAGGVYMPLDPAVPDDRLAFMLDDAGVRFVLADSGGEARVNGVASGRDVEAIGVEHARDWDGITAPPLPARAISPDALAYLLYTSGSTGRPKGVANTHRGLLNHTAWLVRTFALADTDVVLFKTPFTFDVSLWELVAPLAAGARVVIARPEGHKDPRYIAKAIRDEHVTAVHFVASMLNAFLAEPTADLTGVRFVLTSGEAVSYELEQSFFARFPEHPLHDLYGPTEAAIHATAWQCRPESPGPLVPIGRPVANTEAYVLDAALQPVPVGVAGELLLGGAQLARGYYGRPDLTAERFVPHPHGAEPGARLYRTGDLARLRSDGVIEYLGRLDHQVKIRGFRIELGDVEVALARHPDVRDVVVLARGAVTGEKQLVAYLVAESRARTDTQALRAHLKKLLPDYMVPSAFVWLDVFPLLSSGKVNRAALPAPERVSARVYVAPRTPTEEVLAAIWREVLRVERVGIHDDFFELGGHSLLATQIVSRVVRELGAELPLRNIFEEPTLGGLARRIDGTERDDAMLHLPIQAAQREASAPLSHPQLRLWFLDRLEAGSRAYLMPAEIRLRGSLDVAVLERCFNEIAGRHESLRTAFIELDGEARQVAVSSIVIPMTFSDLRGAGDVKTELAALRERALEPFDLSRPPLLRTLLARVDDEDHVLFVTVHHIVSDGWSVGVLLRELGHLYAAHLELPPRASALPALALQYADYAIWQKSWLDRDVLARQLDYWKAHLAGAPTQLTLVTDRPRPSQPSFVGAHATVQLGPAVTDAVHDLARRQGATPFMVLLGVFAMLLARRSGQTDLVIGTPVANRNRRELEDLVGLFANTLPLRIHVPRAASFDALLRSVRDVSLGAYAHQEVPFERLVDALHIPRDLTRTPLFQAMFVWQGQRASVIELPKVVGEVVELSTATSKFDLTLHLAEDAGRVAGYFEYRTDLFDAATIQRMTAELTRLLDGVLDDPSAPVGRLPLMDETERARLLTFAVGATAPRPENLVHELVALQAGRTPSALAVVFEGERLTYAELEERAESLASGLRATGIGPESVVGVCMDRSLDLVVAVLAVLKAHGAYLPLDPEHPSERLSYMLEDSRARLVLVDARGAASLEGVPCRLARVKDLVGQPASSRRRGEVARSLARSLAYVIYTSGSTGVPKAVLVEHASFAASVLALREAYRITLGSQVLQFASIGFDAAVEEIFKALTTGATLHLARKQDLLPGPDLARVLRQRGITHATLPPAALAAVGPDDAPAMRVIVSAGDVCSAEVAQRWASRAVLMNAYGPTEATIGSSVDICVAGETPTIGRPVRGRRVYVVDDEGQLVPPGVEGELWVGGSGVSRGYGGQPSLTAERFVPDPFATEPGARLYRTGDLGRYLSDGRIVYVGRRDQQVKLRGFRIELGEIEARLRAHPDVADCVVVVRTDHGGTDRLTAYVVPKTEEAPSASTLRAHLAAALPDYMLPASIVGLERLPLTTSGKVDRRALPEPPGERVARGYVAPAGDREQILAEVWAAVLHQDHVSVTDNFFELGGDSILALQVIWRAARSGLSLTPKQIFEHPTVRALAAAGDAVIGTAAEQGAVIGPVALTPIQRWFFEQPLHTPARWNQSLLLGVREPLDPTCLRAAVQRVFEHHDALRSRFERVDGSWRAHVMSSLHSDPLSTFDLTALADGEVAAAITVHVEALHASFDLERGPLARLAYFDRGTRAPALLFVVAHHLVVDGVSWRILIEDLEHAYLAARDASSSLGPKTLSVRQWTEIANKQAAALAAEELPFWRGLPWPSSELAREPLLATAPGAPFETSVNVQFSGDETRALMAGLARYRLSAHELLLAALAATVRTRRGDVVHVDVEGHGRDALLQGAEPSRTVGWFTAVFPLVVDLRGIQGAGATLVATKEAIRAVPRQGIGFGVLRYMSEARDELARLPKADIVLNYQGQLDAALVGDAMFHLVEAPCGDPRGAQERGTHAIEVNARVLDGSLQIGVASSGYGVAPFALQAFSDDLVANVRELSAHAQSRSSVVVTPSDFTLIRLSLAELASLERSDAAIEDISPLTATQSGLLFHSLLTPGDASYVAQVTCVLEGEVDVALLEQAWSLSIARQPMFRTTIHWQGLSMPVQIVRRTAGASPVAFVDLRGLPSDEREARAGQLADKDRLTGFDLGTAPLGRLLVLRLGERDHHLVFTNHHIVMDGWSLPIFYGELLRTYKALREQRADFVVSAGLPFQAYVAWLQAQGLEEAEKYFRGALAGFDTPLRLESVADSANRETGYEEQRLELSEATTRGLQALARQHCVTLSTVVLAAWSLVLSRYTSTDDLVFGITVSGRSVPLSGIESMIGLFINTLPLRVLTPSHEPIGPWLLEIQARQEMVRHYEYAPLSAVQGWSGVARGQALFDSIVVFENYPLGDDLLESGSSRGFDVREVRSVDRTNYGVTLTAYAGAKLRLELSFDRAKLPRARAVLLLQHVGHVVSELVRTKGEGVVGDVEILDASERDEIIRVFNATEAPFPHGELLHSGFERQVARDPSAVALLDHGLAVTYGELNARSNQLARHLVRLGVGPDVVVGICCDRSVEMMVGLVAIAKAGGAYLPIQPWHPLDFINGKLQDAGASLLVTQRAFATLVAGTRAHAVVIGDPGLGVEDAANLAPSALPSSVAIVMFTSGSTGRPKGVMLEHAGLVNHIAWMQAMSSLGSGDTVLQFTQYDFDVSAWEIFGTLAAGARLVLDRPGEHRDIEHILELIAVEGVTVLQTVPTVLRALLEHPRSVACTSLKHVFCAGEAMPADLPGRFYARWTARLYNAYGPTEATIDATCAYVSPMDANAAPAIGKPIANTRAYVLDSRLSPVPVGVAGQLYLGGVSLARGYIGQPDTTASAFVCDPISNEAGARLYRTGDIVRHRADGSLEYLGRADQQLKVRGVRIEPGDIEALLRNDPEVQDAVVTMREDRPGDKRLVAYVVAVKGALDTSRLRATLSTQVPEYMVPPTFVQLDHIPLKSNGKLDRTALPAPDTLASREHLAAEDAPRDDRERCVAAAFAAVLGRSHVGRNDSFFALGGDSILSIQVIGRLRAALDIDVPVRLLFDAPRVADLAARLSASDVVVGPRLVATPREAVIPLSLEQERMWLYDQLDARHRLRNVSGGVRLRGALRVDVLERAVQYVVARHETLRTSVPTIDGRPRQVIHDTVATPFEVVDLGSGDAEAALAGALDAQAAEFDLAAAPLIRVRLARVASDDALLIVTMHHVIADHWSVNVFVRELTAAYASLSNNETPSFPPLTIQFADFVQWKRQRGPFDAPYWKALFADNPPVLQLPTDRPRAASVSLAAVAEPIALSAELTAALEALARKHDATLFMVLLAAFQTLLHRYTGQTTVVLGSVVMDRLLPELQPLIGYLNTTLAYRTELASDLTFTELVKRARESVLAASAHPEVPFEELLRDRRDARGTGLFQVFINFVNRSMETSVSLPGLEVTVLPDPPLRFSPFELELSIQATANGITGALVYNTSLFDASTVATMRRHLSSLLAECVRDADQPIGRMSLLDAEERKQQLLTFNATSRDHHAQPFVHDLFAEQASRRPDAIALVCGDRELTYRELYGRVTSLARTLRAAGVRPDDRVGLCARRSVEMIVGLLAILSAGAAYVPLDPAYPEQRLAYMLQDSGARVLCVDRSWRETPRFAVATGTTILSLEEATTGSLIANVATLDDLRLDPEHLAYVIYTSGSTGKPKGVQIPHRALANLLFAFRDKLHVTDKDVLVSVTSISFDIAALEIYLPLVVGARLVIATREETMDGRLLVARMERSGATLVQATPSTFGMVLETSWRAPHVTALVGGEAVPPELARRLRERTRATWNVYGPTETTIWSVACPITSDDVLIGKPLDNTTLYVVDTSMEPVPIGVPGELLIGGLGLARGYFGRPDLTAERFVPSPFGPDGARLYRTGDQVRYRKDGSVEFLGRLDHQVKVRGFRVELGEIEAALSRVTNVRDAVVVVREDAPGDKRLVAYLVARPGEALVGEELRAAAAASLPEYMVPAAFVVMDALPLTANGKVDRKALPLPDAKAAVTAEFVEPEGDIEVHLAKIWCGVLGLERVGAADDFFWLGGHSLLATQMLARVGETFGVDLPLSLIFTMKATVAELANVVRSQQMSSAGDEAVESLLDELESMSDEDALALLAGDERVDETD